MGEHDHLQLCRGYLRSSSEHMDNGELQKASIDAWYAAINAVAIYCNARAFDSRSHANVRGVASQLASETKIGSAYDWAGSAIDLRHNAESNTLDGVGVADRMSHVRQFVALVSLVTDTNILDQP